MEHYDPTDWISLGVAIWMACYGLSLVVAAFRKDRTEWDDDTIEALVDDINALEVRVIDLSDQLIQLRDRPGVLTRDGIK